MTSGHRRKKTPRFSDIAEAAGVSPSTVDRVLNERGSVSAKAREKVVAAARQLAVPRILPQTRRGLIHLDVILPVNNTPFFQRLNLALQRSIGMLDRRIVVHRHYLPEHKNDEIARAIVAPPYRRQGLILSAPDTEPIRQALRTVTENGETAVAIVTNIQEVPALKYAGIDNYRAGRTAGFFLGHLAQRTGRVVVLSSRTDYQGHIDRTRGFRDAMAPFASALQCDPHTIETHDDPDRCYLAVASALSKGPPVAGIYNSGAGSRGIESALRKFRMERQICWITHEISDDHRQYIRQGVLDLVIDQNPDGQIFTALQHLLRAGLAVEGDPLPDEPSEFRIYVAENLREVPYLSDS